MENASKALIIAGAILLSILIIAIGMYIYNSSQNTVTGVTSQFGETEIQTFNQQFTMYEGKQSGTNCKALIGKVIANNSQNQKAGVTDRLVNITYYDSATATTGNTNLSTDTAAKLTLSNWTTQLSNKANACRTYLNARHEYTVECITDTVGFVRAVKIKY